MSNEARLKKLVEQENARSRFTKVIKKVILDEENGNEYAPGAPFPCPHCGATGDWEAHYIVPASQGVELTVGDDLEPDEGEYDGSEHSYDPEGNDSYQCTACDNYINLDGSKRPDNALSDADAIRQIHEMLDGKEWNSAADYLEAIAEIILRTGRTIRPPANRR